jgi:peptide/nickel transport system permease protein
MTMLRYLLRRALLAVVVALLVLVALSAVVRLLPGDPATAILRERATPELVAYVREEMGLNLSVPEQVGSFVVGAVQGDIGEDFFSRRPVRNIVFDALPHTIALAVTAMLMATLLAIPLGVMAATHPGSLLDRFLALTSIVAISIPSLVAGLALLVVLGVRLEVFPVIGTGSFADPVDYAHHLALPAFALALSWIGYLARLLRASLVAELGTTYVRAATAYGIHNRVIFFRYALKNAFIPTLAVIGFGVASLMGGALFVEVIFTRKGVGTVLAYAISTRNYVVVQGIVAVVSVLFILINLAVDLAYRFVDPRVRVEEAQPA